MNQKIKSITLYKDPAALIDKEGHVIDCNSLFQKIVLGKEGRSADYFNVENLGNNVKDAIAKALNGNFVETFTYIEKNGEITDWRVACIPEIDEHILVILTSRSSDIAFYDALTKLPNRHVALDRLDREWERWTRSQKVPFGIALADIDFFKNVNDNYGHDIGDQVLQQVSKSFTNSLRSGDWISRWGGEEFLLLFHDVGSEGSVQAAERCRQEVEKVPFVNEAGLKINITVSIGVVNTILYNKNSNTLISIEKMIEDADILLYDAKREGRNRVISLQDNDHLKWDKNEINNVIKEDSIQVVSKDISYNNNKEGSLWKPYFPNMNRSTPRHFFHSSVRENLNDEAEAYWLDKVYQYYKKNNSDEKVFVTCNSRIFKDIENYPKYSSVIKKFVDDNINLILTSKYNHTIEDFNNKVLETTSNLNVEFCPWIESESTSFASLIANKLNKYIFLCVSGKENNISADKIHKFLKHYKNNNVSIIIPEQLKNEEFDIEKILYINY